MPSQPSRPRGVRPSPVPSRSASSLWVALAGLAVLAGAGPVSEAAPVHAKVPSVAPVAVTPGPLRAEALGLLAQPSVAPEAAWRRLGPGVVPVLAALAEDTSVPDAQRMRAVTALARVEAPEAGQTLQAMLEDPQRPSDVRSQAAAALGQRLGFEAVKTLRARLEDRDLLIREAVAQALGRLGGQQVREVLEERLPLEDVPQVREALQQGLTLAEP
ncbi:HEAT repeat domain-containing protein [Corallococcus aberystwythensis]|uniref:HEAT repeat domain-containing protein n=1 Tax=Corallococcus aberystwythensis TaxID=2316722 RepID=A0A3A8QRC4_9BACT|nr:HEAT repeat domain-containing protein [Corallococcus aberystwythensis]RKH71097.1 HEAT repeat domain-containing protein [Corallococcus aberystwythensis]